MAIVKVGTYRNPPVDITDYEAIVAHLEAYTRQIGNQGMLLTQWGNASGVPAIAKGSYISHGGTLFVVDTEDFLVAAPASNGTYYLRVAGSGASLAVSWVGSLGGYTWNAIYNGLYHADESQILPYQLVKAGAVLTKRKITNLMQGSGFVTVDWTGNVLGIANFGVSGAISGASINTGGLGAFLIGQNLRTTDSPTFVSINASIIPRISLSNSVSLNQGQTYLFPAGLYIILEITGGTIEYSRDNGSTWLNDSSNATGRMFITNGSMVRWNQTAASSRTIYFVKF